MTALLEREPYVEAYRSPRHIVCRIGVAAPAAAEEFPSRPITWIVPFTPGGITDTTSRLVAEEMSKSLGQTVLIDNHALRGDTILDKRRDALERLDHVRRLLVFEPRGHADMYGCFVVEPNDDGADLGVVFFHNAGYSTACGHGTIALVTWALDEGVIERREGENRVVVDVPSGRLETWARSKPAVSGRFDFGTFPRSCGRRDSLSASVSSTSPSAVRSTPRSRSG